MSRNLKKWMSFIDGETSLCQLSIPGTHDSGARYDPEFKKNTAKCQNLSILEQLEAGARYLDIRCCHERNEFNIYHNFVDQNLRFYEVLNACESFLDSNPEEVIIMHVKEEWVPVSNDRSFEETFDVYVTMYPNLFYLHASIPKIRDVRGKIVLLRRFKAEKLPKGIDVTEWEANQTFPIEDKKIIIQDCCEVSDLGKKWDEIHKTLEDAKSLNIDWLYINYTSGFMKIAGPIPQIDWVSNDINPKVLDYFKNVKVNSRFGIVPMDFVTAELCSSIIETNLFRSSLELLCTAVTTYALNSTDKE